MKSIANLFLIAAPRSGSTQLARWLASHPDIEMPMVKEPNYFSASDFPEDYVRKKHLNDLNPERFDPARKSQYAQFAVFRRLVDYQRLYANVGARWKLDASTSYLASTAAPVAIFEADPSAKIIFLTRDPVERAVSHYSLACRTGRTRGTLLDELERELKEVDPPGARYLLRPSRQSAAIVRYQEYFDGEQCLHLEFKELKENPKELIQKISIFLDVNTDGFDLSINARNASATPNFPTLNKLLHDTGLKSFLRSRIPVCVKGAAKPIWFKAASRPVISSRENAYLHWLLRDA